MCLDLFEIALFVGGRFKKFRFLGGRVKNIRYGGRFKHVRCVWVSHVFYVLSEWSSTGKLCTIVDDLRIHLISLEITGSDNSHGTFARNNFHSHHMWIVVRAFAFWTLTLRFRFIRIRSNWKTENHSAAPVDSSCDSWPYFGDTEIPIQNRLTKWRKTSKIQKQKKHPKKQSIFWKTGFQAKKKKTTYRKK